MTNVPLLVRVKQVVGDIRHRPVSAHELHHHRVESDAWEEAVRQGVLQMHQVGETVLYSLTDCGWSIACEMSKLMDQCTELQQSLAQQQSKLQQRLQQHGWTAEQVHALHKQHISLLHTYNEIKDLGQLLLGKLATMEGTITKEIYPRFGLTVDD